MAIGDRQKAVEILSDIGYYRLGFYWFAFETDTRAADRRHKFSDGATFENAVELYYFDNDLRILLSQYISRIETNFKTRVIYYISNHYCENPTWFADGRIMHRQFIAYLPTCYSSVRKNAVIARHHKKHPNEIYAPAWKTLEYMTFGDMLFLFESIKDDALKSLICEKFGIRNPKVFTSLLGSVKALRNACAHGHTIYDFNLARSIKAGPLKDINPENQSNVVGCLIAMSFLLESISANRNRELHSRINALIDEHNSSPILRIISRLRQN